MENGQQRNQRIVFAGTLVLFSLGLAYVFFNPFAPPQEVGEAERFVVPRDVSTSDVVEKLVTEGFVKETWAFNAIHREAILPGAYRLSKDMGAFAISNILKEEPYMKWVVIPEGYRKEQIAELLAEVLGWNEQEKNSWVNTHTSQAFEEVEGVYFPDTYLIPVDESPEEVADRLRARFNEAFQPYLEEALRQNIRWTTLLKIASLVEREAAGAHDMPLVAGVLWNRLLNDQKLDIDATVQYARDTRLAYENDPCENPDSYARDVENNLCFNPDVLQPSAHYRGLKQWWAPITSEDIRSIDSLYNTYLYKGLPPHPIANPGRRAIEAVLFPEETDCFFYLHSDDGNIHCAVTYEEHRENIERYLR